MPRLGDLLLEEKLVTPAQLEEGLENQVIHGGRVGTNLCELGFLQEKDLARVLGRQHNLPFAFGEMVADPQALAVAPLDWFDDNDIVPMRVEPTRITVAVMDPKRVAALDDLAFKAGRRIVEVVVPEFRLNQLLRKYCKAFRPVRPIDVNALRPSKAQTHEGPKVGEVGDLINEDDFASIYAQAAAVEEAVLEGTVIEDEVPVVAGAVVPPAPRPVVVAPPPAPEPVLPPISFAEAQAHLQKSADREDIAQTVLRFAKGKFRRVLLLSVQGDLVTGWRGMGIRVTEKGVRRIGVSLREENTFKMVRDLRSHFLGPMKQTPGMAVFYKLIGGGHPPATAMVLPLLVRGKPVHLLYADNGPRQLTPPDVGELLILSQSVGRSYETLIRARQR